jgi:hypothetical protein
VKSTLTLTFDHDTFALDVKGEAPNHEVFLAMLEQAKRSFEAQLRLHNAMQMQQQIADQQRNQALVNKIRGSA